MNCPPDKILNPKTNRCIKIKPIDNKKPLAEGERKSVKNEIEKELIKKIGKTIPNDLIYNINEDIDYLKKIKNKKQKEKDIKNIINELNESDKIAKEILNETKSKIKKDKVLLFIEYNNKRIQLIYDYLNKEQEQLSSNNNINVGVV